ncbi:MAG: DEAD/DEAH box helicase [Victivallales bacterium]|nr:DEAD/DEAH box helicase [Victivallales bacterium]
MLSAADIPHPSTPPSWLASWPTQSQLEAQFPYAIRKMAILLTTSLKEASVEWDDTTIRAKMNGQMCTWRFDGAKWVKRCTCRAPETQCPHVYMTCLLLQRIFIEEHWITYNRSDVQTASLPQQKTPNRPSMPPRQQDLPGLTNNGQPMTRQPAGAGFFHEDTTNQVKRHQLEVEADFKHEPPKVTIRFYDKENDERGLMSLATLYNISFRISQKHAVFSDWSDRDQAFLGWLFPTIAKIPWQARTINVLKIPRETFTQWQVRWQSDASRFIERDSQQVLQYSEFSVPQGFSVELIPEGEVVKLLASFILPNGEKVAVHDFFSYLEKSPEHNRLAHELKTYHPPIPWPVLEQHFREKPPRMKRALIPGHLSDLLNGHLEIVHGDCVSFKNFTTDHLELYAGSGDNYFFISLLQDGRPINLTSPPTAKATIHDNGSHFTIVLPDAKTIAPIQQTLRDLPFPAQCQETKAIIPASDSGARLLKNVWASLPGDIRRNYSPSVKGILENRPAPVKIVPLISIRQGGPVCEIDLEWTCEGTKLTQGQLVSISRSQQTSFFHLDSGSWLELSPEAAREALLYVSSYSKNDYEDTTLTRRAPETIRKLQQQLHAEFDDNTAKFMERLSKEPPIVLPQVDETLAKVLRPYQRAGVLFLLDRLSCGAGAILADDMGLGKTVQVLATLDAWHRKAASEGKSFRALIISPASVMRTWQQQAQQFCPSLTTMLIQGSSTRRQKIIETSTADILITHYQLARVDHESLLQGTYDFLVLDEAQAIKNPEAQVTNIVSAIKADHAIAMTGTPLENSIIDLWSIMNCINRGFLGDKDSFIASYGNHRGLKALNRKISPLILRRTKRMVMTELPPKTEQVVMMEMPPEQRHIYDLVLFEGKQELYKKGAGAILGLLTRLREICCHPALISSHYSQAPSSKLERLLEQLLTLHDSGHSTLVFSQFTSMLDIIAEKLHEQNLPFLMITGETPLPKRQKFVDEFQNSDTPLTFLLSLKAAGTGLTLTKADYVFLFDPWWNPAVEQQAIDRTHRIGQENPVFAYKFITSGTVEEKVMQLLEQKRELFSAVLDSDDETAVNAALRRLTMEDLQSLLN